MIIVTERKLNIPRSDLVVGCAGDNLVEIRNFELSRFYGDIDLSLFDFKLDTQVGKVKNIIDLAKVVAEETITLTWTIDESHVLYSGYMAIQVRAFHGEVEKWHSAQEHVLVMPSINPAAAQPDVLPSEFEQMEQRVTAVKIQAQEAAQTTTEQANRAQGIADTFSNTTLPVAISAVEAAGQAKVDLAEQQAVIATEKAREASDSAAAALASEQAAKGSEDWARTYAEDAEEFAGDAEEQAQIAANNILNGVDTHNQSDAAHADIRGDIRAVEALARGAMTSYVFDTYEDMMDWLQDPENVAKLKIGDNLYIRDTGVKDYWWDGTSAQELEAEAPDLTDYYTKLQVNAAISAAIAPVTSQLTENADNASLWRKTTGNPVSVYPVPESPLYARVSGMPIQEGEGDPSPENIRPITPWLANGEQITLANSGKNLLNLSTDDIYITSAWAGRKDARPIFLANRVIWGASGNGYLDKITGGTYSTNPLTGDVIVNSTVHGYGLCFRVDAFPNKVYRFNVKVTDVGCYDKDFTYISHFNTVSSITTPPNTAYMLVALSGQGGVTNEFKALQMELGSVATPYEPYTETEITLTAPQEIPAGWMDNEGNGQITHGYIASYVDETVPDGWVSSIGELSAGAQVVYPLATPIDITPTAAPLTALPQLDRVTPRQNVLTVDTGALTVGYAKSPIRESDELQAAIAALS